MNIIFMGTPEFAIPVLSSLIDSKEHKVVAVFTQTPKPKGRGLRITNSQVHDLALFYNIPVYTPKTLRDSATVELINSIEADVIVVVAYGFIIQKNILNIKKYGCLNIHPSKLPKYRGATPLQRTIINGDRESAVCVIQMDEGLDTGDIILKKEFLLSHRITLSELHAQCANIGRKLLLEVLSNIERLPRIKQSQEGASYAHKLSKKEAKIDWRKSSFELDCQVRGMNPWPGPFFKHDGKKIKVLSAEYTKNNHLFIPGNLLNDEFEVACGQGSLKIIKLKPEGKQKMFAKDYLQGIDDYSIGNTIIFF